MSVSFEDLYNSESGIIGMDMFNTVEEFEEGLKEIENNPDFSFLGNFDMVQDADEELEYQGLTLSQITKMSLNRYGDVIETLQDPENGMYWVFIGAR